MFLSIYIEALPQTMIRKLMQFIIIILYKYANLTILIVPIHIVALVSTKVKVLMTCMWSPMQVCLC